MGYIVTRMRESGIRYTAYANDVDGKRISLGTFDTRKSAEKSIQAHELYEPGEEPLVIGSRHVTKGTISPTMTLADYVEKHWLPKYKEVNTYKGYRSLMTHHILPLLGHKQLRQISKTDVRKMLADLRKGKRSDSQILRCFRALSAAMTPLVQDDVIPLHPCTGLKVSRPTRNKRQPILVDELKEILKSLEANQNKAARTFAELLFETGFRYGEATELRVKDFKPKLRAIYLERAVADVSEADNPDKTGRFQVKQTKTKHSRILTISESLRDHLVDHITEHNMGEDDLLFGVLVICPDYVEKPPAVTIDFTDEFIESLGFTAPDEKGFQHRHGTLSGYTKGCRCEYCTAAVRQYRRELRAKKKKTARNKRSPLSVTNRNLTGHMPKEVWRRIWIDAVTPVIGWVPRTHDMRHANATWLLKSGMDLHTVQSRLGHSSITTTEVYLHDVDALDTKSADILRGLLDGPSEVSRIAHKGALPKMDPNSMRALAEELKRLMNNEDDDSAF